MDNIDTVIYQCHIRMEFIVQICLTIELNLSLIDVDHLQGMLINLMNKSHDIKPWY